MEQNEYEKLKVFVDDFIIQFNLALIEFSKAINKLSDAMEKIEWEDIKESMNSIKVNSVLIDAGFVGIYPAEVKSNCLYLALPPDIESLEVEGSPPESPKIKQIALSKYDDHQWLYEGEMNADQLYSFIQRTKK
jgi:hypothetical protein